MMFGILPFKFRFRGKVRLILDIYYSFIDATSAQHGGVALHPTQIARTTGISFTEVAKRLEATPELFVRLPKRDGITRYRITSSATARSHEEIETLLRTAERNESMLFYAVAFMVLAMLAIVVLTIVPNL